MQNTAKIAEDNYLELQALANALSAIPIPLRSKGRIVEDRGKLVITEDVHYKYVTLEDLARKMDSICSKHTDHSAKLVDILAILETLGIIAVESQLNYDISRLEMTRIVATPEPFVSSFN